MKDEDTIDELQALIFQALGEASAVFMSNPLPGTKQIMPEKQLTKIATNLYKAIRELKG